jgi:hypothetical protein
VDLTNLYYDILYRRLEKNMLTSIPDSIGNLDNSIELYFDIIQEVSTKPIGINS